MSPTWIDPELAEILARAPREALPGGFLDFNDLPASRERARTFRPPLPPRPGVEVRDLMVPGPAGAPDIRLRVYRPEGSTETLPLFYWIHGGGMVMGTIDGDDDRLSAYVLQARCLATSVEYRLAPETPDPGPVEDCYAGLVWAAKHAAELGADPGRIAVGGASAGGGLAAGTVLLARDRGGPALVFQLLVYPMLDDRNTTPASHEIIGIGIWDRATNLGGWRALLGDRMGTDAVSIYAAPARARDLAGLPPAFIDVGTADLFRDEDIEYATRLMQVGVPTELHVYPGAYHGYEGFAPKSRITRLATETRYAALTRAFHG